MNPLADALASLPHGAQFRFVDEVTALSPGKSASGSYALTGSEPFLAAHFPGQPIMPAVLMVEAIAQVAGIAAQTDPQTGPLPGLRLAAVRSAKVFRAVGPGERMEITAEITGRLGGLIQAAGMVIVAGERCAEAQVTLSAGG